jgi:hypothetical protein
MTEAEEKAKLIKDALKIVDRLKKFDIDDLMRHNEGMDELNELIEESKKLTKSRHWRLT